MASIWEKVFGLRIQRRFLGEEFPRSQQNEYRIETLDEQGKTIEVLIGNYSGLDGIGGARERVREIAEEVQEVAGHRCRAYMKPIDVPVTYTWQEKRELAEVESYREKELWAKKADRYERNFNNHPGGSYDHSNR